MARRNRNDDLLLEEDDELSAAFLGDDDQQSIQSTSETDNEIAQTPLSQGDPTEDQWDEDEAIPGQLAVDVYETADRLVVKARTAGVNRNELDVSIADNQLTIKGTLSAGNENDVENYFLQECYWGVFQRTIALPVPVKEEDIEANLKDGVLTISFGKLKQDIVKKIQVL